MHIRESIYLAGLLHDIGKFYQRADEPWEKSGQLRQNSKNIADYICPTDWKTKSLAYQHVIWTHDFFEQTSDIWKSLGFDANIFNQELSGQNADNLISLASYHHKPQTRLQAIIQLADWWASGLDREQDYNNFAADNDYSNFRNVALMSIWETISSDIKHGQFGYALNPLALTEDVIFPKQLSENIVNQAAYAKHWNGFLKELQQIAPESNPDKRSIEAFAETLLFLLKRYTWCVPASARKGDMPIVSLFEHLKVTAAIAQCLYDYQEVNPQAFVFEPGKKPHIADGHLPLLLFCGDISGIQSYIYNVASRKAAKSLKGRSYFLQLLTESIIQRVIDGCNVTLGHIVYASGGKFYMLLPNTDKVKDSLKIIEEEVISQIHQEFHGELYVCMDYVPFGYNADFRLIIESAESNYQKEDKPLGKLWQAVLNKVGDKKNRKFRNLLAAQFKDFFEAQGTGGNEPVCEVTGRESKELKVMKPNGTIVPFQKQAIQDDDVLMLPVVAEQVRIGKRLQKSDYMITFREVRERGSYWEEKSIEPIGMKIHHYVFNKRDLTRDEAEFRFISSADVARVRRINDTDFAGFTELKGRQSSYGFTFYGGNKMVANEKGEPLTFEELAKSDNGEEGFNKLGILRMDVDNLGQLFASGITNPSLAAYATLSFQLDLFFSGYLNTIRNSRENFQKRINILYSGGDDLFIIGRWDCVIDFAEEVRTKFRAYVCNRENISISGGVAIVPPKFPIAKAAEMAGEAEHAAKDFNNKAKNAFCLFNQAVGWEKEFAIVKSLKTKMVELRKSESLSASFLQQLMRFQMVKNRHETNANYAEKRDLSYVWNAAYAIGRYKERTKNDVTKDFLDTTQKYLFAGDTHTSRDRYFDLYAIAARWAELELRS